MVVNGGVEFLGKNSLEHLKKQGMSHSQQPHLSTASLVERLIMVATTLLATVRLLQTMPSIKNGYVEGIGSVQLDLALLVVWTWCVYSIRFPNARQEGHRIWGTDVKCYRTEVDDGSFYGALLIPIMSVAKLVDIHKSSKNDSYIEFIQTNTELCILLGCGVILHMFLSKHFTIKKLATIWTIAITSGLSIMIYLILSNFERLPLLKKLPWQYILFSQTFYHVSLYSIAYLFKKSFTFGELAIVAQSITLLAVEAWVVTVNEVFPLYSPVSIRSDSIKFFEYPHPITIFQIALILGMLLIGILLSPFLFRSRYLAQQPMWKAKDPHSFETEKKWTACIIYGGTIIIVLCCLGQWVQMLLKANPYLWIFKFIVDSSTRILLMIYWIAALGISLFLFNYISRTRKHFSLNAKRKYFHALAVAMFIPGYLLDPLFMDLAFSIALSALIYLEYLRYFAVFPVGKQLHLFLSEFVDNRDAGPAILSHIYLLVGCAGCVWLKGNSKIAGLSGILTLGLGDSMASIIGRKYGRRRWHGTSKTFEGTAAFIIFVLLGTAMIDSFLITDQVFTFSQATNATFFDRIAAFGPRLPEDGLEGHLIPLDMIESDNINGCRALEKPFVTPAIVLVERGHCSFIEKVRNMQSSGALAVVVGDPERNGLITMYATGNTSDIQIPSVFVGQKDYSELRSISLISGNPILIMLVKDDLLQWPLLDVIIVVILSPTVVMIFIYVLWRIRQRQLNRQDIAPQQVVCNLPRKIYRQSKRQENDPQECAICLDDYADGDELRIMPCKHEFHVGCIDSWLTTRKKFVSVIFD
ncbi:11147_t:CDS:10 [Ambispora gerdemannii]|uniref:dolichol kinase n=1 Tax=Ambispora gerdemannii TaxID=144530 RepID=A0A9N8YTD5_9GLOM|nr:11147_t:CDS:10 [Ambispora gerdemannii]